MEIPFAAVEGNAGVQQNSRERLVNMYSEVVESGRSRLVRRQRPGLTLNWTLAGVKRGIFKFSHGHYAVIRNKFYKWDGTTLVQKGTLDTSIGNVTMVTDDNGNVGLSDGEKLYHWDATTDAFTKPTTQTAVGTLAFQGGFGIYNVPDAGQWYISGLNDLTSWGALDFATAESESDPLVRVYVDNGEVWLLGTATTEIWRNSGAQAFPYVPNTTMKRGCLAPFSIASDDNTLFWLGNDKIVYRADGYRPARVSTHAIEEWIQGASDASTAKAFFYTTRGHKFYTLTIPGYGTRQFNLSTGVWNEAKTYNQDDWDLVGGAGDPIDYYLNADGVVSLDENKNKDNATVIERYGISAPVYNGGARMRFRGFWADVEVGTVAENVTEPKVWLQISRDGEAFGNIRERGLGETGDYLRRSVWRNLGVGRKFSVKMGCSDDVEFSIMATHGNLS